MVLCVSEREKASGAARVGPREVAGQGTGLCFGAGDVKECALVCARPQRSLAGRGAQGRSLTLEAGGDPLGSESHPAWQTEHGQGLAVQRGSGGSEMGVRLCLPPTLPSDTWSPVWQEPSLSDSGPGHGCQSCLPEP